MFRFPTRWAGDDPARSGLALLMLLCLRGTPVLYQGDEIGLGNVAVTRDDLRDPLGVRYFPSTRDATRGARRCSGGKGTAAASPAPNDHGCRWRPGGGQRGLQRDDPHPAPALCRDVIAYRRRHPAFALADYRPLEAPEGVWAFGRGDRHVVVLNLSAVTLALDGLDGTVALCTDRARDQEVVGCRLETAPFEGLIVERA